MTYGNDAVRKLELDTDQHAAGYRAELLANPFAGHTPDLAADTGLLFDVGHATKVREAFSSWTDYQPTPLTPLPGLASRLRIGEIWAKDEGLRQPVKSFKALGASYALECHLRKLVARKTGLLPPELTSRRLRDHGLKQLFGDIVVTCASDGNHGLALAWTASEFGCQCRVYLPTAVSSNRAAAIASYGAEIIRVDGSYDEAVELAWQESLANGWQMISDTALDGYVTVPADVMRGYSLMVEEVFRSQAAGQTFSHVFLQLGVGAMAAAVIQCFRAGWPGPLPKFVTVEPDTAASLYLSLQRGESKRVYGRHETIMTGLSTGALSTLAWPVLKTGVDYAMTINDAPVAEAMRWLAAGAHDDAPIVAGETGAGGVAALMVAAADDRLREFLDLSGDSRVLVIITEGATDPDRYDQIVGDATG